MTDSRKLSYASWAAVVVLVPTYAWATDMPPVELLLIPPLFGMLVVTALGWFATRLLTNPTARHFLRLLLLALLWTPVPVISWQNYGYSFLFSGLYLWSFLLPVHGSQAPFVIAELGRARLATAIAVSITSVLGSIVILARSWARLRQTRDEHLAFRKQQRREQRGYEPDPHEKSPC